MTIKTHVNAGRSSSSCGHCKRGCDPTALTHDIIVEYGPKSGEPGCGAEFVFCTNTYISSAWLQGQKQRIPRRSRSGL